MTLSPPVVCVCCRVWDGFRDLGGAPPSPSQPRNLSEILCAQSRLSNSNAPHDHEMTPSQNRLHCADTAPVARAAAAPAAQPWAPAAERAHDDGPTDRPTVAPGSSGSGGAWGGRRADWRSWW